jgi:hypothetical protein
MVLARREHPLDVSVQCLHDANVGHHGRAAVAFGDRDQGRAILQCPGARLTSVSESVAFVMRMLRMIWAFQVLVLLVRLSAATL